MAPPTIRTRVGVVAIALVGVVVAAGWPVVARADGRGASASVQRARQHYLAGKHAFEVNSFARALREFQDGYALEPRPGFLLNMGHAARRMGQPRQARDFYVRFLATRPPAAEQRAASKMIADIDRELAHDAPAAGATVEPAPAPVAQPPTQLASPPAAVAIETVAAPSPSEPTLDLRAPAPAGPATPAATAVASPAASGAPGSAPIYRRWWFWAGTGAVAAGVLTAILLGSAGGTSARDNGSWGQLKL